MKKLVALLLSVLVTGNAQAAPPAETYAVQNVQTGKNLRPFRAKRADGNALVLYDHWSWKCMTWEMHATDTGAFHLRNRYTGKTLQASTAPEAGTALWQQPLVGDIPAWEFLPAPVEGYWVRMQGSDLYLTISATETNAPIVLMPLAHSDAQRWRLVAQDPWF